jgi:hypothetical protein
MLASRLKNDPAPREQLLQIGVTGLSTAGNIAIVEGATGIVQ